MKATVICPATPKHVEKYLFQPIYVFHETSEIYETVVLPHLLKQNFSIQVSETDAIFFQLYNFYYACNAFFFFQSDLIFIGFIF